MLLYADNIVILGDIEEGLIKQYVECIYIGPQEGGVIRICRRSNKFDCQVADYRVYA